ncbi:hypothetical protein HDU97_005711 [Phlyctochytrium planicorne]|nr:hypothetical protein HDU97_005711 [Phlyctochytrium planicorne]
MRQAYTIEYKTKAVELARMKGRNNAAKILNIDGPMLGRWMRSHDIMQSLAATLPTMTRTRLPGGIAMVRGKGASMEERRAKKAAKEAAAAAAAAYAASLQDGDGQGPSAGPSNGQDGDPSVLPADAEGPAKKKQRVVNLNHEDLQRLTMPQYPAGQQPPPAPMDPAIGVPALTDIMYVPPPLPPPPAVPKRKYVRRQKANGTPAPSDPGSQPDIFQPAPLNNYDHSTENDDGANMTWNDIQPDDNPIRASPAPPPPIPTVPVAEAENPLLIRRGPGRPPGKRNTRGRISSTMHPVVSHVVAAADAALLLSAAQSGDPAAFAAAGGPSVPQSPTASGTSTTQYWMSPQQTGPAQPAQSPQIPQPLTHADPSMLPPSEITPTRQPVQSVATTPPTPPAHSRNRVTEDLIRIFDLSPHPEGGHFRQIYKSDENVRADLPARFENSFSRSFCTSIYFLLGAGDKSRLHRLKSDETWHFYRGSSLKVVMLDESSQTMSVVTLGNDFERGEIPCYTVRNGLWFGSFSTGDYSFAGCTVSPGFEMQDFEMGDRARLLETFAEAGHDVERMVKFLTN